MSFDWESQRGYRDSVLHGDQNFAFRYPLPGPFTYKERFGGHTDVVQSVHWRGGWDVVSSSLDGTIRRWSAFPAPVKSHAVKLFRSRTAVYSSCLVDSLPGKMIVALSTNPSLALVDFTHAGSIDRLFRGHSGSPVMAVAVDGSGANILSGNQLGSFVINDINSENPIFVSTDVPDDMIVSAGFAPEYSRHAIIASRSGAVTIVDTATPSTPGLTFRGSLGLLSSAVFVTNNTVLIGGVDCIIRLFDIRNPSEATRCFLGHSSGISSLSLSPDRTRFISGSVDGSARIWELAESELESKHEVKFGDFDHVVRNSIPAICTLIGHSQTIQATAWKKDTHNPNHAEILSASSDSFVNHYSLDLSIH
jgi:WD40 repeat protein